MKHRLTFDMKTNSMRQWGAFFLALLLSSASAFADGVSPVLNLFHEDTWIPASIVTVVIVFLEALLLRWRIEGLRFMGALGRSLVLNAASSLTGSVLLIAVSRESFFMWDTMSLVLPLFVITLTTEIPLLLILFKKFSIAWERAFLLGSGINAASYVAVFVLEIGALAGWLGYAGHLDKKELATWKNPTLLNRATGRIYATESSGAEHGLRVFEPQTGQWTSLANCPSLDPNKWDVEGDLCAFVCWTDGDWKQRNIVVSRLPEFASLHEIPATAFADSQFDNWQGATDLAVSPDERKLAMLFRVTDAVAPRDGSSYFDLGSKCRLIVIDVASGREVARASRWASEDGLCWLSDSRQILFPSFDNESLYKTTKAQVSGNTSYGWRRDPRFRQSLFVFDITTEKITRFADGYRPSLARISGHILVRDGDSLLLLDQFGKLVARIVTPRLGFRQPVISPTGDMILAEIRRHLPFYGTGRLVLTSVGQPEVRHVLDDQHYYKFDWAGAGGNAEPAP